MKLHDVTKDDIPEWVQHVAQAWYAMYRLHHMPLVYQPTTGRLTFTHSGQGTERPENEQSVLRETWNTWLKERRHPTFDPAWVIVR